MAVLVKGVG